ncbi:MAG: hypothetical protein U0163_05765 [Gemmatimonadaceae bacterium]
MVIGDRTSIAHGATIVGPATIGASGGEPAFVGFNSYIDGATVDPGAMVTHLARVAPGVVIRKGHKVLPGKFVRTQAEADSFALGKVVPMTEADVAFMEAVLHVNGSFAEGYTELAQTAPGGIQGIGRDPGGTDFNPNSDVPDIGGERGLKPSFRSRIVGRVRIATPADELEQRLGRSVSIRADEGEPFVFGRIGHMQDRVTFHALEHSNITVGDVWSLDTTWWFTVEVTMATRRRDHHHRARRGSQRLVRVVPLHDRQGQRHWHARLHRRLAWLRHRGPRPRHHHQEQTGRHRRVVTLVEASWRRHAPPHPLGTHLPSSAEARDTPADPCGSVFHGSARLHARGGRCLGCEAR